MKEYTLLTLIFCVAAVATDAVLRTGLLKNKLYFLFLLVIFFLKLAVNGFLTHSRTVMYDPRFYLGVRFGSIPVEDFLFGFSMVTVSIALWEYYKRFFSASGKGTL
jgi:lycopene cyclase domain-containing protein